MRDPLGMKRFKVRRTALLALAMVFLASPGSGTLFVAIGRLLVGFVPWTRFKRAFAALVDRLPAPLVLLIFLVPFLIVEPLLVVATVAIAMGYVVSGAIAWIVLKTSGGRAHPGDFRSDAAPAHDHAVVRPGLREGDGVSSLRRPDRRPLQGGRRRSPPPMAPTPARRRTEYPASRISPRVSPRASERTDGRLCLRTGSREGRRQPGP